MCIYALEIKTNKNFNHWLVSVCNSNECIMISELRKVNKYNIFNIFLSISSIDWENHALFWRLSRDFRKTADMSFFIYQKSTCLCMSYDRKTPEERSMCICGFSCYYDQIPSKPLLKIRRHYFGWQFKEGAVYHGRQSRRVAGHNAFAVKKQRVARCWANFWSLKAHTQWLTFSRELHPLKIPQPTTASNQTQEPTNKEHFTCKYIKKTSRILPVASFSLHLSN